MEVPTALALCALLFASGGEAQVEFSYDADGGPERWAEEFPKCGGQRQSPVDIQVNQTSKATAAPLWMDFPGSIPWQANLTNNGHTALVQLEPAVPITLRGGPLTAPYVFQQLHFHWGSSDAQGSEHAVNSRFAAMELHMVFYKQQYGAPSNAANYSDGFVVVTTLLDRNENGNPVLPPIVYALQRVRNYGDVTTLDGRLALEALLPSDRHLYFSYAGSLTTPPCDEAVTWIIFQQRVPVSSQQVAAFRTLKTEDGSLLVSNRRPLQPLGDRTVSSLRFGASSHHGKTNAHHGKASAHHSKASAYHGKTSAHH